MDVDQRRHLEQMREIHRQRLMVLEKQAARLGDYVPSHIPVEIEELHAKIQQIDSQLGNSAAAGSPSASATIEAQQLASAPSAAVHEMIPARTRREQVFISYSHKDEKWLKRLQTHLAPLERAGIVKRWDDTSIAPGSRWQQEIEQAIKSAKVAVLLISADFLASEFITTNELPPLLDAAEREGAVILPVIVGASLFESDKALSQFQSVNPPDQPLSAMSRAKQEAFLVKVAQSIKDALQR